MMFRNNFYIKNLLLSSIALGLILLLNMPQPVSAQESISLETGPTWQSNDNDNSTSLAWGDFDGDGDLDLAVGNAINSDHDQSSRSSRSNKIYVNEDGILNTSEPIILATQGIKNGANEYVTADVAWGDVDGDGDLDLISGNGANIYDWLVSPPSSDSDDSDSDDNDSDENSQTAFSCEDAPNVLHINDEGVLQAGIPIGGSDCTTSVAWGDADGDGDLDLAVGNWNGRNKIYLNNQGELVEAWQSDDSLHTNSIFWADIDQDGDLDLLAGNGKRIAPSRSRIECEGEENYLYINNLNPSETPQVSDSEQFTFSKQGVSFGREIDCTLSIVSANLNRNDTLEIFEANWVEPNKLYSTNVITNIGAATITNSITVTAIWTDSVTYESLNRPNTTDHNLGTFQAALGDVDQDGDIDIGITTSAPRVAFDGITLDGADIFVSIYENIHDSASATSQIFENHSNVCDSQILSGCVWRSDFSGTIRDLAWADVDNDRDIDLAVSHVQSGPNSLYLNSGGPFTAEPSLVIPLETDGEGAGKSGEWGDMDNDGDLDLVVGTTRHILIFWNKDGMLIEDETLFVYEIGATVDDRTNVMDLKLADINNDTLLDIISAHGQFRGGQTPFPNYMHLNKGSREFVTLVVDPRAERLTKGVAVGDIDGDGDLDLVFANGETGQSFINTHYINISATNIFTPAFRLVSSWTPDLDSSRDAAFGDFDQDGDLDLAIANTSQMDFVYLNEGGSLTKEPVWTSSALSPSQDVAWIDVSGNGHNDLFIANFSSANLLYQNIDGELTNTVWSSDDSDPTQALAYGDVDGDLDIDVIVGNYIQGSSSVDKLHLNQDGQLTDGIDIVKPINEERDFGPNSPGIALGDFDRDGDLDLARITNRNVWLYENSSIQPDITPTMYITHPIQTGAANYYATPIILDEQFITVTYEIIPNRDAGLTIQRIDAFYSKDGGGKWDKAEQRVEETPLEVREGTNRFVWDTFAAGLFGNFDNVVFALRASYTANPQSASPLLKFNYFNQAAGPYQYASVTSSTFPFRVRGTQIRITEAADQEVTGGDEGVLDAIAYLLPEGQDAGGTVISSRDTTLQPRATAFRTNAQGYLSGRGEIGTGARLLALAPAKDNWWADLPWMQNPLTTTQSLFETIHLYTTNAVPHPDGVHTSIKNEITGEVDTSVQGPGVQQLQVSDANKLLLFDLRVALEWDASQDPDRAYLSRLESDLQIASKYIYDFTNGQAALGHITVTQNADDWGIADVVVQATNRLRPYAVQGGIVLTPTTETINGTPIVFETGHVRMGSTWNRFGNPGQTQGADWPLTLAHELSHYLFFLEDTYLGLVVEDGQEFLIPVDECVGSVMADMYAPSEINTEFLTEADWAGCINTLAHATFGRSEWETIEQYYPGILQRPSDANAGPVRMPFNLTEVTILPPKIVTQTETAVGGTALLPSVPVEQPVTLPDTLFYLNYVDGGVSSNSARAYLIKPSVDGTEDLLVDLGSPYGGQNQLMVRGPTVGDTLCVVDPQRDHFGCETVAANDEDIDLSMNAAWQPDIRVSPINSVTIKIEVYNVEEIAQPLKARIYQEMVPASAVIDLTSDPATGVASAIYTATTIIADNGEQVRIPVMMGHLQLWAQENDSSKARREAFVDFRIGGNPGKAPFVRWASSALRQRGPFVRWASTLQRNSNAPVVSADGQMIFFTTHFDEFDVSDLYTVQSSSILESTLPDGKEVVGLGYRMVGSPSLESNEEPIPGSISFQYLGTDTLALGITEGAAEEEKVQIHFYDEDIAGTTGRWRALTTKTSAKYNLASAPNQGAGLYALLAGKTMPRAGSLSQAWVYGNESTALNISGQDFLGPVAVVVNPSVGAPITLTATVTNASLIGVELPNTLIQQPYSLTLINGDGTASPVDLPLTVLRAPQNPQECFFDEFEAGMGQWQTDGAWDIVQLPDGSHGLTDSPGGSYTNAPKPTTTLTSTVTSRPFDLTNCPNGTLTLRHAYVIAQGTDPDEAIGVHQDWAKVEIRTTISNTWAALIEFSGGGVYPPTQVEAADVATNGDEWRNVPFRNKEVSLQGYSGLAQLRFTLQSDRNVTDKGWAIDDMQITAVPTGLDERTEPTANRILLPIIDR